jgi:hypothetical protein
MGQSALQLTCFERFIHLSFTVTRFIVCYRGNKAGAVLTYVMYVEAVGPVSKSELSPWGRDCEAVGVGMLPLIIGNGVS